MKLKIKTDALKVAVAKAVKGSSTQGILALSTAMMLRTVGTDLVLTTTDNALVLSVTIKGVANGEGAFVACTDSLLFAKLISKQSSEYVVLTVTENELHVSGDGEYSLHLLLDEEGSLVEIDDIEIPEVTAHKVAVAELKNVITYNSSAVSKYFDTPIYTAYCMAGDKVITYDGAKSCISKISDTKITGLFSSKMCDLFSLFEDKEVSFYIDNDNGKVVITSSDVCISGYLMSGIEEYPAQALIDLVYSDMFSEKFSVSRGALINTLDRISLFISEKEQNEVRLVVKEDGLCINNKETSAYEKIKFVDTKKTPLLTAVSVDLNDIKAFVSVCNAENITFMYSAGSPVCLTSEDVRYVIPLLEEVEEEEYAEEQ